MQKSQIPNTFRIKKTINLLLVHNNEHNKLRTENAPRIKTVSTKSFTFLIEGILKYA